MYFQLLRSSEETNPVPKGPPACPRKAMWLGPGQYKQRDRKKNVARRRLKTENKGKGCSLGVLLGQLDMTASLRKNRMVK